ncbi:hypothetical protein HDV02_003791 [Globomyces sp. JEL0801]|nr:hypothetical protein HDV02_003791 [Globomyces sp. JEL0801]
MGGIFEDRISQQECVTELNSYLFMWPALNTDLKEEDSTVSGRDYWAQYGIQDYSVLGKILEDS